MGQLFSKKNKEVFSAPLGIDNPVTVQVLGICSALAVTAQLEPAIVMGLSVTVITAFAKVVISLLRKMCIRDRSYANTPTDKAIRNAIGSNDIRKLALNQDNLKGMDTHFSIKVSSKGITDQKSSGRCWLFTGLNVMRAKAIAKHNLGSFEFSQTYPFFFDQLEKANLFLQGIIDTSSKPMDDKMVEWLFRNPLSDGGTFTGGADIVSKYGLVPKRCV